MYYFDSDTKDKEIWQVLFILDYEQDLPQDFLDNMLTNAFGKPTVVAEKNKNMAWNISKTENLFHEPKESMYTVKSKDYIPPEFYESRPKKRRSDVSALDRKPGAVHDR